MYMMDSLTATALLQAADVDGDGVISLEDFRSMLDGNTRKVPGKV